MSSEFINLEIDKIMGDSTLEFPKNLAMACAWILGNFKGINLKVLEMGPENSLAEFFVLASASNPNQASAMADEIVGQAIRNGYEPLSKEGLKSGSDWLLLDIGDVLIHIFLDSARDVYGLDSLWKDANIVEIPQSYYFSSEEASQEATTNDQGRKFF